MEKTGAPTAPTAAHVARLSAPSFEPKSAPAQNTANVAKLIGTGPIGITICESTAVIAANIAHNIIFNVFDFFKLHLSVPLIVAFHNLEPDFSMQYYCNKKVTSGKPKGKKD
jgi:hypothetical protein